MGGKPQTPEVPDYVGAAKETGQQNIDYLNKQTQANRPNQYNPMGSSTWSQDANGNWTNNVAYSPQVQGIYDTYMKNVGQQGGMAGGFLSAFGDNNAKYTGMQDELMQKGLGLDQQGAQDAYLARMQPQMDQKTNALMASLAAQGMTPGGDAYNASVGLNNQQQNDLWNTAVLNSGQWAGQQLSNLGSQYQMANALRTQPLGDYQSLMQGTSPSQPSFGNFSQAGAAQGTDLSGAMKNQYDAQLGAANAGKASGVGMGSGIGTVAGGVLGSVVPGLGTMAGAGIGGALGGLVGGLF